jgi:hypothetical protein
MHLPVTRRLPLPGVLLAAAGAASLISLLACGAGPAAPAESPIVVQSVTLTPAVDTVLAGDSVALIASITADGPAPAAGYIGWSVTPSAAETIAPDRLSARFTFSAPGTYAITVRALDKTAHATVTVLAFPLDSPFLGAWRLVALRLQPDGGGDPELVPFISGSMAVDPVGRIGIYIVYPDPYPYGDDSNPRNYPFVRSDGSRLLLCQTPEGKFCDTATWTFDGTRLSMLGPAGSFDFGGGRFKSGMPEWEFER